MLDPIQRKTMEIERSACAPAHGIARFIREELAEILAESALPTVDEYNDAVRWIGEVQSIADALVRPPPTGGGAPAVLQGHSQRLTAAAAGLRRFVDRG